MTSVAVHDPAQDSSVIISKTKHTQTQDRVQLSPNAKMVRGTLLQRTVTMYKYLHTYIGTFQNTWNNSTRILIGYPFAPSFKILF